jgi:hypothetical protein
MDHWYINQWIDAATFNRHRKQPGSYANTATISEADPTPGNNSATVTPFHNVGITKTVNATPNQAVT